ncbi:hypothetical protein Bbelb_313130 [Branchiostoma belcheri]|nr:hypothetical protein Bbelb_313130 [Branchiostoma belcheri]
MPRSPRKKRGNLCTGCGEPLSTHKAGEAGNDCKRNNSTDSSTSSNTGETTGKTTQLDTAALQQRKAELEAAIRDAELRHDVQELEKKLQRLTTASPHPPTVPGTGSSAGVAALLGDADVTLDQLRKDSQLLTKVDEKLAHLDGASVTKPPPSKGKRKVLSPESFVFNCESADVKNYDDLTPEEFLSGSMGLLLSDELTEEERLGRILLLQYTCNRLARYKWSVVRAFHSAAVQRALQSNTGTWSSDWNTLKEFFFDGDTSKLKPKSAPPPPPGVRREIAVHKVMLPIQQERLHYHLLQVRPRLPFLLGQDGPALQTSEADCRRRKESKKDDHTDDTNCTESSVSVSLSDCKASASNVAPVPSACSIAPRLAPEPGSCDLYSSLPTGAHVLRCLQPGTAYNDPCSTADVPKKDSAVRRIVVDFSYPGGSSVNAGIPTDSYLGERLVLKYPSVDDFLSIVVRLGPGCLLYKRDLKRAYRQLYVDPGDYHLLGFCWRGQYYADVIASCVRPAVHRQVSTLPVDDEFRKDIAWWRTFLPTYNGISIIPQHGWSSADEIFSSDACLTGCGGFLNSTGEYFHATFPHTVLDRQPCINCLELLSILVCVRKWGPRWAGQRIVVLCDNEASVTVLNSGRTRSPFLQSCLRNVWLCAAQSQFELKAVRLPGVHNRLADNLSRWHSSPYYAQEFTRLTRDIRTSAVGVLDSLAAQLAALDRAVDGAKQSAFAEGTYKNLKTQWRAYLLVCEHFRLTALPAETRTLARYAQFLSRSLKSHTSTCQRLRLTVRLLHLFQGLTPPPAGAFDLRLVLSSLQRHSTHVPQQKLPITPAILLQIHGHLDVTRPLHASLWAAFCVAFFGLLRKSNLVPKSSAAFDTDKHLTRQSFHASEGGLVNRGCTTHLHGASSMELAPWR